MKEAYKYCRREYSKSDDTNNNNKKGTLMDNSSKDLYRSVYLKLSEFVEKEMLGTLRAKAGETGIDINEIVTFNCEQVKDHILNHLFGTKASPETATVTKAPETLPPMMGEQKAQTPAQNLQGETQQMVQNPTQGNPTGISQQQQQPQGAQTPFVPPAPTQQQQAPTQQQQAPPQTFQPPGPSAPVQQPGVGIGTGNLAQAPQPGAIGAPIPPTAPVTTPQTAIPQQLAPPPTGGAQAMQQAASPDTLTQILSKLEDLEGKIDRFGEGMNLFGERLSEEHTMIAHLFRETMLPDAMSIKDITKYYPQLNAAGEFSALSYAKQRQTQS